MYESPRLFKIQNSILNFEVAIRTLKEVCGYSSYFRGGLKADVIELITIFQSCQWFECSEQWNILLICCIAGVFVCKLSYVFSRNEKKGVNRVPKLQTDIPV
jgi:hypothetical protein